MADMVVKLVAGATTKTIGLGENTDGNFTRAMEGLDWGELVPTTYGHPLARGHGWVETARPTFSTPRSFSTLLRTGYTGSNPERNLRGDFEDMVNLLTARASSPVVMRVDTLDSAGGAVSRILDVRAVNKSMNWGDAAKWFGTASGSYRLPIKWEAKFPLWRDLENTVVTDAVTLTNANLNDPATMEIDGIADAGLRVVLSAISGTVTSVSVLNDNNGYAVEMLDAGLANGNYIDFNVTSPNAPPDWSGGTLSATSDMALELGSNSLTVAATGTGTWSVTVTLSTRQFWGTP